MKRPLLCLALAGSLVAAGYVLAQHAARGGPADSPAIRVLLEQTLAEKLNGKEAKVTLIEVTKGPGEAASPHRHPGPVVGYVLEGELEFQVEGRPLHTYHKGDVFFEPAGALHAVSRNPSKTQPVRFLAFFLMGAEEKRLVIPANP